MNANRWIGTVLVILGIGFILQQADVIEFTSLLTKWWPALLIIAGLITFTERSRGSATTALILIGVGALLLVQRLTNIQIGGYIWPLILVVVGLIVLFARPNHLFQKPAPEEAADAVGSLALFSEANLVSYSDQFRGGTVTAIFGSAEVDLTEITLSEEGAALEIVAVFGEVRVRVPENIRVEVSGVPVFGSFENKTKKFSEREDGRPALKIHSVSVFGSAEVRD